MVDKASDAAQMIKSGHAGVHKLGKLYRAFVAVANLEIYSRGCTRVEEAIEDHMILVQLRHVIAQALAAGKDENELQKLCRNPLTMNNPSQEKIQLCVKVRVRASEWLGSLRIGSRL